MRTTKFVQIILIILCALTILAGCTPVQPQEAPSPTAAVAGTLTQAPTEALTQTPTQAPTEAPTTAPTEAPTLTPTQTATETSSPTQVPTQAPTPEPTPEPTPTPTPQAATVTISIDCRNATEGGVPGAPEGGWILGKKTVELQDGDTVWDVLSRICKDRGIAINKSGSGASIFVKSIGGVAPVSAQSGWMYSVNGAYVQTSSGKYVLSSGDSIRWKYTMNGGDDL